MWPLPTSIVCGEANGSVYRLSCLLLAFCRLRGLVDSVAALGDFVKLIYFTTAHAYPRVVACNLEVMLQVAC